MTVYRSIFEIKNEFEQITQERNERRIQDLKRRKNESNGTCSADLNIYETCTLHEYDLSSYDKCLICHKTTNKTVVIKTQYIPNWKNIENGDSFCDMAAA